jgi:inorganic triphosphatase YgiF
MTNRVPFEIELKLALPPQGVNGFLARMARRRIPPTVAALHTRYFDTPDFELSRSGVAVRVRRVGRRWVQTLKTEGERQGGLSQRIEYEMPVARGVPDWSRFPPEALALVPAALRARLVPVFETRFERTAWLLTGRGGAQIEVALDRGEVRAGSRHEPICEIELELKRGEPDALFDLARTWAAAFACLPNDESKAARGVRLAHDRAPAPVRSGALKLDPAQNMEDGFATICRDALAQFQANLPGVLGSHPNPLQGGEGANAGPKPMDDIEYVHQARVALRRLRAVLRLARRACVLPPALQDGLRALAAALGPARDWDVMCLETWPAVAPPFGDAQAIMAETARLEAHRASVRAAMRAALTAAQPGVWLLDMARWLLARGWRDAPAAQRRLQLSPLADWARDTLRRGHRAVLHDAHHFAALTPEARHALRIRIKRLRYALEFFLTLYPGRNHARLLAVLRDMQDALGQANDAHVAAQLLQSLPDAPTPARAFALGWLAAREAAGPCINAKALKNFVKLRVDW